MAGDGRATGRWFRDVYRDAVWESEDLSATEKAVAETYARHARDKDDDKSATADLAWLTYPRLMVKAGIGRRANVSAAVVSLVAQGWLTVVREASRRPTLYRLTIPARSSDGGTSDRGSDVGTTVVPKIASGSSASVAGSSDGGTQPLGPSVKPPSVVEREMPAKKFTSRQRADAEGFRMLTVVRDYNEPQALHLIKELNRKYGIYSAAWWIEADENGSLDTRIKEVKAEYLAEQAAKRDGRTPQPMRGLPDPWAA
ncbi:hypothetical protein AB0K35_27705 [Micromonospora sp. NPDC053740]|uniref:hypothetical protein n=1 Tax=Micromonospora sp. NPDC053740 TaxID=3155173 RepID=UPI0034455AB0